MFANYDEMTSRHEVIKTFCAQHRYGLTVVGGVLAERQRLANREDYMKFLDDLSIDEFTGNYLTALLTPFAVDIYKRVLDGELGFYDFIEQTVGKDVRETVQGIIENS